MQPYGNDRCRETAGRIVLHSQIPKAWTPRTPAALRHSEHPGTTVLWDGRYFEVVEATGLEQGGVRYVLQPWRDEHTIRVFDAYDEESEQRRIADHELARRQRRASSLATWSGFVLGHLPGSVQNDLQNRLGVVPFRMTLLSCVPPVVLFGVCAFVGVGAFMTDEPSPVPLWLMLLATVLALESGIRYWVAMSTSHGIGSLIGTIGWTVFWIVSPNRKRLVPPLNPRGESIRFTPPSEDRAMNDAFEAIAPFLTLLPGDEQRRLQELRGFDYRRYASAVAFIVLVFSTAGAYTSWMSIDDTGRAATVLSVIVAAWLAIEQIIRLFLLRRGPAGSVLGILVRALTGNLLRSATRERPQDPADARQSERSAEE